MKLTPLYVCGNLLPHPLWNPSRAIAVKRDLRLVSIRDELIAPKEHQMGKTPLPSSFSYR